MTELIDPGQTEVNDGFIGTWGPFNDGDYSFSIRKDPEIPTQYIGQGTWGGATPFTLTQRGANVLYTEEYGSNPSLWTMYVSGNTLRYMNLGDDSGSRAYTSYAKKASD